MGRFCSNFPITPNPANHLSRRQLDNSNPNPIKKTKMQLHGDILHICK
ncbi:hypothetical protein D1AOALGA4SA_4556 [Olavius algarvensis Delta 1 endosymbiont]|nr:hypothetical protein D1AOALGA4SA_4556 [Olavius algarvensis Delta 1 endosymbiont]